MGKVLLSIQVASDTRQQLKVLAAKRGVSIRALIEPALHKILMSDSGKHPAPPSDGSPGILPCHPF